MVLCDTNIFIHAFNGNEETINKLDLIGFNQIVLSSVTVMELYQGMGNKLELARLKSKIKYYDVVHINTNVSRLATDLIGQFKLSHHLQIPDALIGATAIGYDIPFFTYNTKDFDFMPGIKLFK